MGITVGVFIHVATKLILPKDLPVILNSCYLEE